MADFFEQSINNYSGLSTETKPSLAAGNAVPNGSRWREIDTGDTYFFNKADDKWYLYEQGFKLIAGSRPVVDTRSLDLLEQILVALKKIEYHLALATDADLTNTEV